MSIDIAGATEAAAVLLTDSELAGTSLTSPLKADWNTQIIGAYDLIYPHMHIDFPSRLEVKDAIQQTMVMHHAGTPHFGKYSHPGGYTAAMLPVMQPNTTTIGQVLVRAIGTTVMSIGYGIGGEV